MRGNNCSRCIHTDSPCVPFDYGKDKYNYCDHFKSVFEENEELKEQNIKAKEIIKTMLIYQEGFSHLGELKQEAEQFLKED